MSAGYEYNYELERERKRDIYLNRIRNNTRGFLDRYEKTLRSIENHDLVQFVDRDYNNARNRIAEANSMLQYDPEQARDISRNIGNSINTMFKRGQERRKVYNQQEKNRKAQNIKKERELEKQRSYARKQQENIEKLKTHINGFVEKYENILIDIQKNDLSQYILEDYTQASTSIGEIKSQLNTNPQYAKELSLSLGEWIKQLPKQAIANKTQDIKKKQDDEEAKLKKELFLKEEKLKKLKKLKMEFDYLLDEELINLKDPILRDYAIGDITILVDKVKKETITEANFEILKKYFQEESIKIINTAQFKTDEFNKKYFQETDEEIEKESILEEIKEKKQEIENIISDNPEKLKNIMDNLLKIEDGVASNNLNNTHEHLLNIANDIVNEEVNEEYRKHTVKSIFVILKKLGFTPTKPKIKNGEVTLKAQRINGNEFEAIIKLDGSMMSHFNGYSYDACKDDIENLEGELQSCYGIDLKKTKTIWQNPDRIEKDAKPISELNRQG